MKRLAKILMLSSVAVMMFTACSKDNQKEKEVENGQLTLSLKQEGDFVITEGGATSSQAPMTKASASTDLSKFYVEVESTDGTWYKKWNSYTEMPEVVTLPADEYVITAANGTLQKAQWEAPFYLGERSFSVDIQELASVSLTARLANVKVTIAFSDEFLSLLDDVKAIVSNDVDGVLEFSASETRAGYFAVPANKTLTVTVTAKRKSTGVAVQETLLITDVETRQWHKINVGVATSGSASFDLIIDDEMIEKEDEIIIPDADDIIDNNGDNGNWDDDDQGDDNPTGGEGEGEGDEPQDTPAPVLAGASLNGSAFDLSQPVVLSQAQAANCTLDVSITAAGNGVTIQNLFVKINAPTIPDVMLEELGLLAEFDMANLDPNSVTYATLTNEPICLVDPAAPIKGKVAHTFSVGKFMSMLAGLGTGTNSFSIKVVDSVGKSSQATLTVTITE
ncbi:MAG: DUF4493 domain-containing protein [Flavobacteriales bacterium]|nr:DUF4493 domain-containing protein [Flavobacteriales bacterium]